MNNRKLMVEENICTGCRYCEAVCSLVHSKEGISNPRRARIQIHSDVFIGLDKPVVCRQCAIPKCVEACPVGALSKDKETGAIHLDEATCTGCMVCLEACPFGAVAQDEVTSQALICDLCGGDPACAKFCRNLPHIGRPTLSYITPREYSERRLKR